MFSRFTLSATNVDITSLNEREIIPLTEILRTHDAVHSCVNIPSFYAIASIIDMHLLTHIAEFKEIKAASQGDASRLVRTYAFMGPDAKGEHRVFYVINAFSELHAKYLCIQDCAKSALQIDSRYHHYAYSITHFLRDFYCEDLEFNNVIDHFRAFDLSPYTIVNMDDVEIGCHLERA